MVDLLEANLTNVLNNSILNCTSCTLRYHCNSAVTPEGNWKLCDVMVVDAMPGAGEEKTQMSFSSKAGQKLKTMFEMLGAPWNEVYKTTVVKCRPDKGGMPDGWLAETCATKFLDYEVNMIQPKIIITFGSLPTNHFLTDQPNFHNSTGHPRRVTVESGDMSHDTVIFPMYPLNQMDYKFEPNKSIWQGFRLLARLKSDNWQVPKDTITTWQEVTPETMVEINEADFNNGKLHFPEQAYLDDTIFLDTEWSPDGVIWCVTLSNMVGDVFYLDVSPGSWFQTGSTAKKQLRQALNKRTVVMHNSLADILALDQLGVKINKFEDTYIMAYILQLPSLGLKNIASSWAGMEMASFASVAQGKDFTKVADTEDGRYYACRDVDATRRIFPMLYAEIQAMGMEDVYQTDMDCLPLALEMMSNGILVNPDSMKKLENKLIAARDIVLKKARDLAGDPDLNVGSYKQVSNVLYDQFKLPKGPKTKSGWSTAKPYLETIEELHPIVEHVVEYRRLDKLIGTYVKPIPLHAAKHPDNRVRATIKPATAETGRWASGDPINAQNQPTRDEEGREVREGFEAEKGMAWLSVDQSQIELRTLAHRSRDPGLIRAFQEGIDIHSYTASQVHGCELEDVTYVQRRDAKFLNFGVPYGIGANGVLNQANSSIRRENKQKMKNVKVGDVALKLEPLRNLQWAQNFIEAYFKRFPGIRRYHDEIKTSLAQTAYVESLSGRRRYIYSISMATTGQRARAERQAVNMPIQELAAFSMKKAMGVTVPLAMGRLRDWGIVIRPLIQVHDSLDFEVGWENPNDDWSETFESVGSGTGLHIVFATPQNAVQIAAREIIKALEDAYPLTVPTVADASFGPNWGSLKPVELS